MFSVIYKEASRVFLLFNPIFIADEPSNHEQIIRAFKILYNEDTPVNSGL